MTENATPREQFVPGYTIAAISSIIVLVAFFAVPYVSSFVVVNATGIQLANAAAEAGSEGADSGDPTASMLAALWMVPLAAVIALTSVLIGVGGPPSDSRRSGVSIALMLTGGIFAFVLFVLLVFLASQGQEGGSVLAGGSYLTLIGIIGIGAGGAIEQIALAGNRSKNASK
ncbi:hypothetical protein [Nonomuraea sp. NPDC049695]|uniref:hypothetical protein n=1 Tax=Nonomuraea sp. NPDC049695 TaxID=3154734 RepID=UPI0034388A4F